MRELVLSVIVVLLVLVAGRENSCRESCCIEQYNKQQNKDNKQRTPIKQNLSNCIEKCQVAWGGDVRNISKRHQCGADSEGGVVFDKLPTGNNTKKIRCNDLLKDSLATNNFNASPGGIRTDFYRQRTGNHTYDYVNITWTPLNITDKSRIWTHYAVFLVIGEVIRGKVPPCHFGLVPKDQTFLVISSSNLYKYPERISFNVFTYPFKRNTTEALLSQYASPLRRTPNFPNLKVKVTNPKTPKPEITASLMAAIIVGTLVGIAFFVAVAVAWRFYGRRTPTFPKPGCQIVEEESKVYLSYYNENDKFMEYIMANVVKPVINMGYDVMMDKMYVNDQVEEGPARWAQTHIASSSKVIIVCSPRYVEICQKGQAAVRDNRSKTEQSRVWFEIQIISNIYTKNESASKIICVWMNEGRPPDGLPPWMGVTYTWPKDIDEIVRRLKRPNRKTFKSTSTTESNCSYSVDISDDDVF